ncbi:MAG: NAD(P)-dependent oxidoreductase [Acetobacteraceae bacterium]
MRIHIQNEADNPLFAITAGAWQEAARRAGENVSVHELSIGETARDLAASLPHAEALITAPGPLAAALPAAAPALRLIFCTSAGVDGLAPFDRLPPRAALVCNRGIHGEKVGEYAIMAILMLAMRLPALIAAQQRGIWRPHYTPTLAGRRLVVLGLGTLGGAAASRARAFGMAVIGVSLSGRPHPACHSTLPVSALDTALAEAEFLLLACPLTALTRGMIDHRRLALLPTGASVINIGRGAVLVEEALAGMLRAGHLGGAVLDVFGAEPLPPDHYLWRTPNLMVTPHVSADDPTTYNARTLDRFFAALEQLRRGATPLNLVDRTRGY